MRAILSMIGNESQPGLQLVEKPGTTLKCIKCIVGKICIKKIAALIFVY